VRKKKREQKKMVQRASQQYSHMAPVSVRPELRAFLPFLGCGGGR
jgi:hypothetical protein